MKLLTITITMFLLCTLSFADLAVIKNGKFTGTFYNEDKIEYRTFHQNQGEICVWMETRPEIVGTNGTKRFSRPVYRLPTAEELSANDERLVWGNAFLMVCDRITGSTNHTKISFEALPSILIPIKNSNRETYEDIRDAFDLINSACIKKFGLSWWDNVTWSTNAVVTNQANQILLNLGM